MKIQKMVYTSKGLYGIDYDEFFTKEELVELCNLVEDQLPPDTHVIDSWIEDNVIHIEIETKDWYNYSNDTKIDFRKIKKPSDLFKYVEPIAKDFNEQIQKDVDSINSSKSIKCKKSINFDADLDSVVEEVQATARMCMIQEYGFSESDVDDYLHISKEYSEEYNATKIQVRAELSYGGLMDLCEALDPIVQKYDADSYFEPVTSGIIEAWVYGDNIAAATNTCGIPAKVDVDITAESEQPIDPPEENADLVIEDGITDEIEFTLSDVKIYTEWGTDVQFKDTNWLNDVDSNLSSNIGSIREVPSDVILNDTLDVIAFEIDAPTGNYKLSGDITLVYTISGVTSVDEYSEEDGQVNTEYDASDVEYKLDFRKSSIRNMKLEPISQ